MTDEPNQPVPPPVCECPRHRLLKPVVTATGWLAAATATLSIAALPYESTETFCGIWGCYPPLPALAAMHLFWGVVVAALVWMVGAVAPRRIAALGWLLLLAGLGATGIVVGDDLNDWFRRVPDDFHAHWPKRVAYTVVTHTDRPLVQTIAAGLVCVALAPRWRRS